MNYSQYIADLKAKSNVPNLELLTVAEIVRKICIDTFDDLNENNCYLQSLPSKPDFALVFVDSGGDAYSDRINLDEDFVQIIARGQGETPFRMLSKIKLALCSSQSIEMPESKVKIIGVWAASNVANMGQDDQKRNLTTSNFRLILEYNNKGNRN